MSIKLTPGEIKKTKLAPASVKKLSKNPKEQEAGKTTTPELSIPYNAFDVGAFSARVNRSGIARPTLFKVQMYIPPALNDVEGKDSIAPHLELYCVGAEIPGVQMADIPVERYGYGPVDRIPHMPLFGNVPLNFICDGKGNIQRFFEDWMSIISRHGKSEPFNADGPIRPYELTYKKEYATQIHILQYNEGGNLTHRTRLNWAYPLAYSQMQLSWAAQNQFMVLPVQFTYFDRTNDLVIDADSDSVTESTPSLSEDTQLSFTQKYVKKTSATTKFKSTFKQPQNIKDIKSLADKSGDKLGTFRGRTKGPRNP